MKKLMLVLFFFGSFLSYSEAQIIGDDKKVTRREERFVNRKTQGERKLRIKRWKDAKSKRKLNAKVKRRRNRTSIITKIFGGNGKRKGSLQGTNGWFAREPGKHVKETPFP